VLNEQLAVVQESADEARVRALVSETPLASQEHNERRATPTPWCGRRDALDKTVVDLERRQDELLAAVATAHSDGSRCSGDERGAGMTAAEGSATLARVVIAEDEASCASTSRRSW